jgi:glycosyltransferase involved in cell wall biosynthesis
MKTVSVAMATYNGARFIREQLDSLARQTVLPAELVITDDGSTDNTLEIVADFAARAPFPVRVERNPENLGFRANFLKAASLCTSDLIAFCDQDDIWLPHKIETCLELFDNDNVLFVYHNATVVDDNLKPVGNIAWQAAQKPINPPLSMGPWTVCHGFTNVIAKSLLAHMNFWPQSQNFFDVGLRESHDQWFPCLAGVLGTTGYISAPLALYRRHQATVTVDRAEISLRQRFKGKFGTHLDGLLSRENCAAYRTFVMETIAASPDASRIDQVVRAAHLYRNLESYYRQRREMYQTNGHSKRLRLLIALARSGCYRPQAQWGVGARALARDIFSGICFGASGTAA